MRAKCRRHRDGTVTARSGRSSGPRFASNALLAPPPAADREIDAAAAPKKRPGLRPLPGDATPGDAERVAARDPSEAAMPPRDPPPGDGERGASHGRDGAPHRGR